MRLFDARLAGPTAIASARSRKREDPEAENTSPWRLSAYARASRPNPAGLRSKPTRPARAGEPPTDASNRHRRDDRARCNAYSGMSPSCESTPSTDGEPRVRTGMRCRDSAALSEWRCRCDERVWHERRTSAHRLSVALVSPLDAIVGRPPGTVALQTGAAHACPARCPRAHGPGARTEGVRYLRTMPGPDATVT
jgi:hypothetical protein